MATQPVVLRRRPAGGLRQAAGRVRAAGREDDTMLVHITPTEVEMLKEMFGEPTINPQTGLQEFGLWKSIKKAFKSAAPIIAPVLSAVAPGIGSGVGALLGASPQWAGALGSGLIGAGLGALGGGGKGALTGGILGGLGGYFIPGAVGNGAVQGFSDPFAGGIFGTGGTGTLGSGGVTMGGVTIDPTSGLPTASGSLTPAATAGSAIGGASGSGALRAATGAGAGGSSWLGRNMPLVMAGLAAAGGLGGGGGQPTQGTVSTSTQSDDFNKPLPAFSFNRTPRSTSNVDWYTYGERPEMVFFDDNALPGDDDKKDGESAGTAMAARGGRMPQRSGALSRQARYYGQPSRASARADNIDAKLSPKEYVMDGETMALLGDGNPDAGADKLDQMRVALRKHKGGALSRGKFSPNAKAPEAYMRGGRR